MQIHGQQLWATPMFFVHNEHADSLHPPIIEHLYTLRSRESERIASGVAAGAKSDYGLFESKFDLFKSELPQMKALTRFIGNALAHAVVQANGGTDDPRDVRVCAIESWFHITNESGYHDAHHHHGCSWCGIYYVQIGDGVTDELRHNGISRFYSPLAIGGAYQDYGTEYLQTGTYNVKPEEGMLVLFPSYLLHSALPYKGEKDRIVIAFNGQVTRRQDG